MPKLDNLPFDKGQVLSPLGVGHVKLFVESMGSWRAVLGDCACTQAAVEVDSVAAIPPC